MATGVPLPMSNRDTTFMHSYMPADIKVVADHLFEEDAAGHRLVEHLGERELGLQDGELVAKLGRVP
jgi:hypothetical protein